MTMIPRIFHQVWIGPNALDERFQAWAASWRDMHPDWDLVLWTDQPDDHAGPWTDISLIPPLINSGMLRALQAKTAGGCRKHAHSRYMATLSDVVRMEVVARYGGVYLDVDVECFQPIDDLLDNVRLFCADEAGPASGNFMFGAEKNHPALWTCVRELWPHVYRQKDGVNPVLATGPAYLNAQLRKHPDLVLFPWQLFNPLRANTDPEQVVHWPRASFGNHHFVGTWYSRNKRKPRGPFVGGAA